MESSEWIGRVGDVWAAEWPRTDRTFAPVDRALVDAAVSALAAIASADAAVPHILDIGCGAGSTSLSLAARLPDATLTGIDLSPALVAVARDRAAGEPRCRFEQADATRWGDRESVAAENGFGRNGTEGGDPKEGGASGDAPRGARGAFDLLVSRHGVMFFDDPVAAFAHLRGLARPGAALVFSCFRSPADNVWASGLASLMPGGGAGDPQAPGPFAFADTERVAAILAQAGWRDATPRPLDFAYVAGGGPDPVADAIDFFSRVGPVSRALREADPPVRERLHEGLAALVARHHAGDHVAFPAAAWIWSARA